MGKKPPEWKKFMLRGVMRPYQLDKKKFTRKDEAEKEAERLKEKGFNVRRMEFRENRKSIYRLYKRKLPSYIHQLASERAAIRRGMEEKR